MIRNDKDMVWAAAHHFIPVSGFGWTYEATGAAGVKSVGAGTPAAANLNFIEIGATGVVGVVLTTAGDSMMGHWALPYDLDRRQPVYGRVHWSSGSTDVADTIDWLVQFTAIVYNTTAIIDPATALNFVIAQDTVPVATANIWCVTAFGRINADTFTDLVEGITLEVEMDAFAAGLAEAKHLIGIEFMYTPRRMAGIDGMGYEAKRRSTALGDVD